MILPKKLEKKRDFFIESRYGDEQWPEYDESHRTIARESWNACANSLLPEIEKLVEAIKFASAEDMWESDGEYVESFSYQYKEWYQDKLDEALQSLREFLGEESES